MPKPDQRSKRKKLPGGVVSVAEIAWLAGIIDGEGCLSLSRNRGKYITPTLQISNTDKRLADWLIEHCGGTYYIRDDSERGRKPTYNWRCAGAVAREIVRAVYPYLKLKDLQAALILDLDDRFALGPGQGTSRRLSKSDFRFIESSVVKMREMNRRGL